MTLSPEAEALWREECAATYRYYAKLYGRRNPMPDPELESYMREEHHMKPDPDPWVDRSRGMRCQTCMFFVPKRRDIVTDNVIGRCRRNAPTMRGYPVVFDRDWCGEHRLQ